MEAAKYRAFLNRACRQLDGGWVEECKRVGRKRFDSQDDEFSWLYDDDARGDQGEGHDEHDQCGQYEAAEQQ